MQHSPEDQDPDYVSLHLCLLGTQEVETVKDETGEVNALPEIKDENFMLVP